MIRLSDSIISTKITRPPVRQELVLRHSLHEILTTSLEQRFTLVSAPAGYGKTTLVNAWLEELN
jgi:LuxR family maltose regulon positive regulatory protein